jgi:hypothetical protein
MERKIEHVEDEIDFGPANIVGSDECKGVFGGSDSCLLVKLAEGAINGCFAFVQFSAGNVPAQPFNFIRMSFEEKDAALKFAENAGGFNGRVEIARALKEHLSGHFKIFSKY